MCKNINENEKIENKNKIYFYILFIYINISAILSAKETLNIYLILAYYTYYLISMILETKKINRYLKINYHYLWATKRRIGMCVTDWWFIIWHLRTDDENFKDLQKYLNSIMLLNVLNVVGLIIIVQLSCIYGALFQLNLK
ncbi:hypothetical protein WG909_11410 [Peptostreptococcaceae bacterium AGR-M142]